MLELIPNSIPRGYRVPWEVGVCDEKERETKSCNLVAELSIGRWGPPSSGKQANLSRGWNQQRLCSSGYACWVEPICNSATMWRRGAVAVIIQFDSDSLLSVCESWAVLSLESGNPSTWGQCVCGGSLTRLLLCFLIEKARFWGVSCKVKRTICNSNV